MCWIYKTFYFTSNLVNKFDNLIVPDVTNRYIPHMLTDKNLIANIGIKSFIFCNLTFRMTYKLNFILDAYFGIKNL